MRPQHDPGGRPTSICGHCAEAVLGRRIGLACGKAEPLYGLCGVLGNAMAHVIGGAQIGLGRGQALIG